MKLESEATAIPGPASIIPAPPLFIGDDSGSKALGSFLYFLWNSPFQACFPVLGAVNTLLAKADLHWHWSANAVPSPLQKHFRNCHLLQPCSCDICHVTTSSKPCRDLGISQEADLPGRMGGDLLNIQRGDTFPRGHWRRRWQSRGTRTGGRKRRHGEFSQVKPGLAKAGGSRVALSWCLTLNRGISLCFPWETTSGLSFLTFV